MSLLLLFGGTTAASTVGPSVSTLTALATGQARIQWVAAIEGCPYLLTDGDPSQVLTAWTGTDWIQALPGLTVQGDWSQKLDPWNPFPGGGSLTLSVQPDSTQDTFGVLVHKTAANVDSELTAALDPDDTTIAVRSTSQFAAGPSELFIGTECIGYSAIASSTALTVSARGKYAPFKADTEATSRFGRNHRIGVTSNRVNVPPIASQEPRSWVGRWVGLWMHIKVDGGLNTRDDALCVFAGRIAAVSDSSSTGCTVIEVTAVQDALGDTAIGKDFFTASVRDGVYLDDSSEFGIADYNAVTTKTANPLTLTAGYYTVEDLASELNEWLGAEKTAGRLSGTYTVEAPFQELNGDWRTKIAWRISGSPPDTVSWSLSMPSHVFKAFGFGEASTTDSVMSISDSGLPSANHTYTSNDAPVRKFFTHPAEFGLDFRVGLENELGAVVDQRDMLPTSGSPFIDPDVTHKLGLFAVAGGVVVAGYADSELHFVWPFPLLGFGSPASFDAVLRYGEDDSQFQVRQVFALQGAPSTIIPKLLASTGAEGYNHATYDVFPANLGAAIPWELLGDQFVADCATLDAGAGDMVIAVDKPTTLRELLGADLILRGASMMWKEGVLRVVQWCTPGAGSAVATLSESNKGVATSIKDTQRSAIEVSDQFLRNQIKIEYGRVPNSETYSNSFIIEDIGSVDDLGGVARPQTISMRNSLSTYVATSASVEASLPRFLALLPLWSRPMWKIKRSIAPPLFESLVPGDIVTITDSFARDPETGRRGLSKQGMILSNRHDWGGAPSGGGKPRPLYGEVEIMLIALDRTGLYSPAAQLDETANTGGFTAGYSSAGPSLQVYAHKHTDPLHDADATYFTAGDKIDIIEIDPDNPAAPTRWSRTIAGVAGNVITLTATLSSPAFDSTKRYRVVSQAFASATAAQQLRVYQADDADGRIQDLAPPYVLGAIQQYQTSTESYADLAERHYELAFGDGAPLDPGVEHGLMRTVNHLVGNKTRVHAGFLFETEVTASVTGSDWECVAYAPIFLGPQVYPSGQARKFRCAAHFCAESAGTEGKVRVSLSQKPPRSTDAANPYVNMDILSPSSQMTATTSSTTHDLSADMDLTVAPLTADGEAWLIVEIQDNTKIWGLPKANERRV